MQSKKSFYILSCFIASLLFSSNFVYSQSQEALNQFNKERNTIQKKGMATLGAWSIGSIAYSSVGLMNASGVNQQFHTMNVLWSGINLALAVPGYIGASKGNPALSLRKTYKEQSNAEKVFLFNAGLDAAYIMGGLYLTEKSKTASTKRKYDQNLGYGNAIILQGGFLFLLDFTLFAVHNHHGNKKLAPLLENITIGANSIGLIHRF